jgi:flagellar hook-basal body complex protein FliE
MALPIKPMNFPTVDLASSRIANAPKVGGTGGISNVPGISGNEKAGSDFSSKLREVLHEANAPQAKAEQVADDYASGKQNDLHGTMITMTQADVQLRLVTNVRNKVIEAYREIMRMGS